MTKSRLVIALLVIITVVAVFVGCRSQGQPDDIDNGREPIDETRSINLYFMAGEEATRLMPVERTVPQGPDILKRTAELLIAGPTSDERARSMYPVLPPSTRVLSAVVSGDILILDLSRELITTTDFPVSAEAESMALEAIALTFGQFNEIRTVRILVEGKQEGTIDDREIADFWGHVGLPPTIRTRKSSDEAAQTAGAPTDGLKLTDIRWAYEEGRLRIVFDIVNADGTPAAEIPFTRAELSPDGQSILVFLGGMRGTEARAPTPDSPLSLATPVATALEWRHGEDHGDDQMYPFALNLVAGKVTGFQLFGLLEPVRVVLDVYGE